jgi:hypothetical protein
MSKQVKVYYSGKRLPLKITAPWIGADMVVFGDMREAMMHPEAAERLIRENPKTFKLVDQVPEPEAPKEESKAQKPEPKKGK